MKNGPIKVAIIGGGCAGITAAFELTRPVHRDKYEVTVYQLGWRLGGKGASGRGPAARIEEHGLHLWMGFYENAFRLMRECYAEVKRDPKVCPIADWRDAFKPDPLIGVMDHTPDGRWVPWLSPFPPLPGLPGDSDGPARWTVTDYLSRSVTLLRTLFEAVQRRTEATAPAPAASETASERVAERSPADVTDTMTKLIRYGELATLTALLESIRILDTVVRSLPNYPGEIILQFHDTITTAARRQLESLIQKDDETRRLWEVAELVLATIRGIVRFRLATDPRGFDAIDNYDCREWLRLNGASERALDSAFLRALYDLAFAYEDGDPSRPRIAAGQALRGAVRAFFTYRGAFFWKMQAGMGDIVFAPFYEALKKRGVRFEFFHRLENVGLGSERAGAPSFVERLEFDVQAEVEGGKPYEPLVDVKGLPCWPSEPRWEQLVDGGNLKEEKRQFESHWDRRFVRKKTLEASRDFDLVVLAVGLGVVPHACRELVAASQKWRAMVEHCKTVPTQAFQIWTSETMEDLGWRGDQVNISGYVEPFDTWADMRQLIARETFRSSVGGVAYFCNVLPDAAPGEDTQSPKYPLARREEVRQNCITFLNDDVHRLWPRSVSEPGQFRWELLVDPKGPTGPKGPPKAKSKRPDESRFDSQYWTANVNPTDRYSLSLPGTLRYRVSPLDATFENLTVAGDWTDCGFNEGCVEAAVISGRLAAHAISEAPRLEDIVGYDHP
jgi:uncharacterized protein with NAD-binding domain and iron-sulfur cluster